MVDKMRRRVLELSRGRIVRDEATGLYQRDETTREFESLRAMRRSAAPSFAALATVLVLGVFIPIVQATKSAANSVRSRVIVDVYMKTSATAGDMTRVRKELLGVQHVKTVEFESTQQAYAQQSKADPAADALLASNPLPDTFRVIPDDPANVLAIHLALTPKGSTIDASVQTVSYKKDDPKKILEVTNLVTITAAAPAILLTLASVLLIGNTIRLSLFARRQGSGGHEARECDRLFHPLAVRDRGDDCRRRRGAGRDRDPRDHQGRAG
jgi:cell division protein FtsX